MIEFNLRRLPILLLAVLAACSSVGPTTQQISRPDPAEPEASPVRQPLAPAEQSASNTLPDARHRDESSVYFAFVSTKIDDRGLALLRRHAAWLKEHPDAVVTLFAFTDNLGSRSYNLALAEERINSVVAALHELGVTKKQIRRKSAGLGKMSANCNTQPCRQQMRRVDLIYNRPFP
ncbi:OmpA family protein [Accumulibacter sp.]|uniref:OmpA family protein n=1 Tax=Accumulibacter sp. TaxID=2053492 RepID=UPI0033151A2A